MFKDLNEAVSWIESVKRFGDKLDLSRMELASQLLGHPERAFQVIHVAGTNGKGSTVSYLKHVLLEAGYNVGTYTSPYIVRFNERISYNNEDISDDDLFHYITQIKGLYDQVLSEHNEVITFFELVTLISFLYFRDLDVDYVVYEVGLGGRLDATNIVQPIMTAITSISFDHMGVLGDTLPQIAREKLGIVKPNIPLVTSVDEEELNDIFIEVCEKNNSDLIVVHKEDMTDIDYGSYTNYKYKNREYTIKLLGTHQVQNASLAIEMINQMNVRKLCDVPYEAIKKGLEKAFWPGRLESFGNVYLDGAHNIGGTMALKDSVSVLFKDKYIKVLYTSMADKEYFDNIQIIESFADEMYFTEFDYPRCERADTLYEVSNHPKKYKVYDALSALEELRQLKDNEILIVTGSLYFVSYIRKALV
jgi:dihydrofolate synthase/folylpolyglutamate synthase